MALPKPANPAQNPSIMAPCHHQSKNTKPTRPSLATAHSQNTIPGNHNHRFHFTTANYSQPPNHLILSFNSSTLCRDHHKPKTATPRARARENCRTARQILAAPPCSPSRNAVLISPPVSPSSFLAMAAPASLSGLQPIVDPLRQEAQAIAPALPARVDAITDLLYPPSLPPSPPSPIKPELMLPCRDSSFLAPATKLLQQKTRK
ncbi:hypothetical protein M0R45_006033 [Rubus argutus]|uniref:Uncharacterized protein n=1 Tax=Rubus argutus TaxID=59490 RepID=A0AAW1YPT0_RUBAR